MVEAFESLGIAEPYAHQVQAADAAHAGLDAALAASAARYGWQAGRVETERSEASAKSTGSGGHVIVATGTASGKTLSYLMPTLDAIYRASCGEPVSSTSAYSGAENLNNRANVLYISPAKALSADQLTALTSYNLPGLHAASYDGDTPTGERRWIREHANFILTTPDMLNYSILSNHRQWASVPARATLRGARRSTQLPRRFRRAHRQSAAPPAPRLRTLPHRACVLQRLRNQLQPGRVFLQAHRRAAAGGHRHYRVHLRTR